MRFAAGVSGGTRRQRCLLLGHWVAGVSDPSPLVNSCTSTPDPINAMGVLIPRWRGIRPELSESTFPVNCRVDLVFTSFFYINLL